MREMPTPMGAVLPMATATTPSDRARPSAKRRACPGGATGERDHSPGDRVRPGDDLGLVAGLGVDEQQQNGMRSVVDRGEGERGCVVSSFARVARPPRLRHRLRARTRRRLPSSHVDRAVRANRPRLGHAGDKRTSRGCLRLGGKGLGVCVTGGEEQNQPWLLAEGRDRTVDGVRAGVLTRRRRGSGHAVQGGGVTAGSIAANVRARERVPTGYRRPRATRNSQRTARVVLTWDEDGSPHSRPWSSRWPFPLRRRARMPRSSAGVPSCPPWRFPTIPPARTTASQVASSA